MTSCRPLVVLEVSTLVVPAVVVSLTEPNDSVAPSGSG